jgi:hypothetical protein
MLKTLMPAVALSLATFAVPASASVTTTVDGDGQFTDPAITGAFHDVFSFSLATAGIVNADYSGAPSALTITDFGLYSGTTERTTFSSFTIGNNVMGGTDSVLLDPGSYMVEVTGSISGATGKYNGNLYVSAVPLPASAALFGFSLLLVGGLGAWRGRAHRVAARPVG